MLNALCKTSGIYVLKFGYGGVIYYITNNFLLFYLERERADEVAVAEEINGIEAVLYLLYGPIAGAVVRFAAILDLLHEGVMDLLVLKREEEVVFFAEEFSVGFGDSCVEVLHSRCAGDILRDDEVELQFAYLSGHAGLLVAFVEGGEGTGSHLEHGGAGDGLRELSVEC